MKLFKYFQLFFCLGTAVILILFSNDSRNGAYQALILAQNTIIPSLLPLLIIFFLIIKSDMKKIISRLLGGICLRIFKLPKITAPAILFGLIGGYPTGALITLELYQNQEIDKYQAQRIMLFNLCGGCGFIITAVGSGVYKSTLIGLILFLSNIISCIIIGFTLSLFSKAPNNELYDFSADINLSNAIQVSTTKAINAILTVAAYIILFGAINGALKIPNSISPFFEITNGITSNKPSIPLCSFYLSFGGICIHLQILEIILKFELSYMKFLMSRITSAILSYWISKLLLIIIPINESVFSNIDTQIPVFSSVNMALSILLILGSLVLVLDISSKKHFSNNHNH